MQQTKILVVEDDKEIADILTQFLQSQNYIVDVASNGLEGFEAFQKETYDLLILDVMMPKIEGFTLCEMIRHTSQVPIIMLTALNGEEEQIRGFELGVDDYVTKPFSMRVLLKRVENVLSHYKKEEQPITLSYDNISVDKQKMQIFEGENMIEMTAKEYEMVCYFIENQGKVITRQELLDQIWQYEYCGDGRVIDTHIKNIRKKLANLPIQTIRARGYLLDEENK